MAESRKLTAEAAVKAVGVPQIAVSPDGSQIAYVTTAASKTDEVGQMTIWLVPSDGSAKPKRLTTSDCIDMEPHWSPDGKRLAFLSDRKERGKMQAYVLELGGGEASRLTDSKGSLTGLAWSPDGGKLAFTAMSEEDADEKKRREERFDHKIIDFKPVRGSLFVVDVPDDLAELSGDELPEPKRISAEGKHLGSMGGTGFDWAPDGKAIVSIVSETPKAHYGFSPDMIVYDLDGNETHLGNFPGALARPKFSPDGSTIAFMGVEDEVPSFFALRTIPSGGGESTLLMPKYEGSFGDVTWLPDGTGLLTTVEQGERRWLGTVHVEENTVTPAVAGQDFPATVQAFAMSADGETIAFARQSTTELTDVYAARRGEGPKKLTDLNAWIRDVDLGEVREVSWKAPDGLTIQGLLLLPVGYEEGKRYPTMLHIHGGPCGAWTAEPFVNWHSWGQFLAQKGYVVLAPNPRGSSGRGAEFLNAIRNCYGEPDWDDLMAGVDYLIDEGIADPDQLVVGGWSGGGFLTNWTVTHTDRFKAAVSGAGISNWVSFQGTADVRSVFDGYLGPVDTDPENHWRLSPIRYIQNAVTPTLILYGENDIRVPPSQGFEMYEGLKARGVETELVLYPREPHGLGERNHQLDLIERVVNWYERHLGRAEAAEPEVESDAEVAE